jgi:hypothetical protein
MLRHFIRKNRTTVVHAVFRKYLKSTREFWKVAQQCADKGSPDRKHALQKAIKLQLNLIECQAMRFAYLIAQDTCDWTSLGSISSLNERLDQGWGKNEESDLLEANSLYKDVVREIDDIKSDLDSNALAESIQELEKNVKYRDARQVVADRVQKLNDGLRRYQQ